MERLPASIFNIRGEQEPNESDEQYNATKKPCRLVTLSCWLALLTFLIVVMQYVTSLLNDIVANEKFWQMSQTLISLYERKINVTK